MPFSFFAGPDPARFKSATKRGVACMFVAVPAFTVMAQQTVPLPPSPFPTSRSVAWDGEIMDNIVLRYRRVLRYPEVADRIVALINQQGCVISPTVADAWRRQSEEYEEVVYLSGTSKRTEKREVAMGPGGSCAEPVSLIPIHSIDIRTIERRIKYWSKGDQRKVSVTETPSEILPSMRSRAQARLRNARNPRTGIGRSMGRVWTEQATFNGFDCGSTILGVEHLCSLLEQPRHVATNTPISVRTKALTDDPRCENSAASESNHPNVLFVCLTIGSVELVSFEKNARIPRNLFEMPPEARGVPVNRTEIPEADEDRGRD